MIKIDEIGEEKLDNAFISLVPVEESGEADSALVLASSTQPVLEAFGALIVVLLPPRNYFNIFWHFGRTLTTWQCHLRYRSSQNELLLCVRLTTSML